MTPRSDPHDATAEPRTDGRATRRLRVSVTVVVTLMIVLAEFGFLTGVYHLGDDVAAQRTAWSRLTGTLRTAQTPDAAVTAAVDRDLRRLADAGVSRRDLDGLRAAAEASQGAADGSSADRLGRLRAEAAALGRDLADREAAVDRRAALIHAGLLVLVSIGWFVWFRRLVRRHREVQRQLTQRQAAHVGERRLLALVQNSADLVTVLEHDSMASFASPAAAAVLGLPSEDLVGRRVLDLLHPDDVPVFVQLLSSSREGDQRVQLRMRHADGRMLVVEGTLTNLLADPAVNGWVLTVRDVTDRHVLQEQLEYQAFHDSLTGLANRQLFADRLSHALRRRTGSAHTSGRGSAGQPLVVLFCDLDDFKNVNDSLGHGFGDRLLVAVAEQISGAVREGDTAARLGGDEFAILMEDADLAVARSVAERLQRSLVGPLSLDGQPSSVRVSIGMALAVPGQDTGEEALRNADVAMYWAKDRGKSTIAVYEPHLHAQASRRLELRADLQQAISDGQLVLNYQPTVDLRSGLVVGFEALVRWQHPERGLLGPGEFIPLAEQTGLIVPLGEWVLHEACRAGAGLQTGVHRPSIAVNIAAQQLARDDFIALVSRALSSSGLPTDRLVLEITESVLLGDMEAAGARLAALRELGVRVAIDDFGTGYSSLAYLAKLPVDVLKVDKSFIDQVTSGGHGASVTEAIITMSQTLELETVAEGVELREQAAWLQRLHCRLGQGYLWSRPVDLESARALLHQGVPGGTALVAP